VAAGSAERQYLDNCFSEKNEVLRTAQTKTENREEELASKLCKLHGKNSEGKKNIQNGFFSD